MTTEEETLISMLEKLYWIETENGSIKHMGSTY
jgi:hypothetical protein